MTEFYVDWAGLGVSEKPTGEVVIYRNDTPVGNIDSDGDLKLHEKFEGNREKWEPAISKAAHEAFWRTKDSPDGLIVPEELTKFLQM